MISKNITNGIRVLTVKNQYLTVSVAPELGGKIVNIYNKNLQKEFLWTNQNLPLQKHERGADYDSNFFGGIDELLPNDIPEKIDGINYPDHGELWTTALQYENHDNKIIMQGKLELSGLFYSKTLSLDSTKPLIHLDYNIKNLTDQPRHFLWKLHAALWIEAGDKIITNAKYAQVADAAYSRFTTLKPFRWPVIEEENASLIPAKTNTMDFFYLYDIPDGNMQLISKNDKHRFSYEYDKNVFPYQWYFASYGGFLNHYAAVLEPCTNMQVSVNEAKQKKQCAALQPGEMLSTGVQIYAGEKN